LSAVVHGPRVLRLACASDDVGRAQVAVDDVGSGIGAGTADKLLQPLFTTKANGMGMGLAICKSILDAHGGTLALLPRKTAGTRAVFSLPRLDPGAGARNV
jgi:signal transduction histidine kinase